MGASHATARPRPVEDDQDGDPVMAALADYRATLAEIRAAIRRGGQGTGALTRALWRMGAGEDAILALARQQATARAIAEQAVADYKASLQPATRLQAVRPT